MKGTAFNPYSGFCHKCKHRGEDKGGNGDGSEICMACYRHPCLSNQYEPEEKVKP